MAKYVLSKAASERLEEAALRLSVEPKALLAEVVDLGLTRREAAPPKADGAGSAIDAAFDELMAATGRTESEVMADALAALQEKLSQEEVVLATCRWKPRIIRDGYEVPAGWQAEPKGPGYGAYLGRGATVAAALDDLYARIHAEKPDLKFDVALADAVVGDTATRDERTQRPAATAAPRVPPFPQFLADLGARFEGVDAVPLVDLRRQMPQYTRGAFDSYLNKAEGYELRGAVSDRSKLSEEQRAAGIVRFGVMYTEVWRA